MKQIFFIAIIFIATVLFALDNEEIKQAYHDSYKYEKMGNYPDAIKAILPVLKEYPNGYTVNLRLGWLYYLNANYADALSYYEKATILAPYSLEAKLGHTLPLLAQQKYAQVEAETYQILNIDYYNYYGNLRLAYVLRRQTKTDLAEKVVLKMLTAYPVDVSFLSELALLKVAQGKTSDAMGIFNDIIILDPENVTAKEYLKN